MMRLYSLVSSFLAIVLVAPGLSFFSHTALAQPAESYQATYVLREMDELEQLTAPVALYPDAILAQVLIACSYPDDVISAARWLSAGNDPGGIDDQEWDLSIKGVARYASALNYMASHLDWMNDLGDAFLNQESDVMTSVQLLRAQANAAGNLVSNDQQQVITDGDVIEIIPAQPQVIYVPQYDPQVVYVERRRYVGERWEPLESFGSGIAVGDWLRHDCDWHDHAVYVGDWGRDRPWWHRDEQRGHGEDVHRYADYRPGTYRSTNVTNVRNTTIINNRVDVPNVVTNVQTGHWQRDARKPAPRPSARTGNRAPNARPATGYPAVKPTAERALSDPPRIVALPADTRGAVVSKASNRGKQSRSSAAVQPTEATPRSAPAARPAPTPRADPPAPAPARPTPTPPAASPAPTPIRPAPTARPSRTPPAAAPAPAPARPARSARPAPTPPEARPSAPTRGGAVSGYQDGAAASHSSDRGAASRGKSPPQKRG